MTRPGIRRIPFHAFLTPLALCAFAAMPVDAQETAPDLPFEVILSDVTEDPAAALEVAAARAAWVHPFTAQDLDRMMSFYSEDIYSYDLMAAPTGDGLAMAFDGEASWRQNWISLFGMFDDDLVITINNLTVYQQGDLATVRGLTRLEGTLVGGPFVDMWVRETNVLRRVNDRWLVLHDHVSVPIDFATGQALTGLGPIGL
jgi:ketosteroid isomerase-like protein